jgi:hypothetical protein
MNGDGCLDAIEADVYGFLTVAKGTCNGNFTQTNPVAELGDVEAAIAVIDINGDGKLDVVASSAYYNSLGDTPDGGVKYGAPGGYLVSVLQGDGNGGVSPAAISRVGSDAFSLAVTDLNGDKMPEIVTISQTENKATLLLNDGSGGFNKNPGETIGYTSGVTNAPLPSVSPQTVDINGDGSPDVLLLESGVHSTQPNEITALLNNGKGTLGPPVRTPISVGPISPFALFVAGNFRNTSAADLIYIDLDELPNDVAFFPGLGSGAFGTPTTLATLPNPYQLVSGDFNGDQKLDFAVIGYAQAPGSTTSYSTGEIDVFLGNGDGTFKHLAPVTFTPQTSQFPQQLIAGDFNHDGKLDLLIAYGINEDWVVGGDDLDLALGNGDGTFQTPTTLMAHFGPVAVGDLNHDGYLDLVQARDPDTNATDQSLTYAGSFVAPAITIYLGGPGGTFQKQPTYLLPGVAVSSFAPPLLGDFNGDGNLDVALPYLPSVHVIPWEHRLEILQGVGDGTFEAVGVPYQLPVYDQPIVGGDYRGVGVTDLLDLVGFSSSINTIPATPSPALSIVIDASPLSTNQGSATVTLALPATSSLSVALSISDPAVQLPSSVTFTTGESQQSFPFTIGSGLDNTHVIAFYATLNGQTAIAYLTKANPNSTPGVAASIDTSTSLGQNVTQTISFPPGGTIDLSFILKSVNGYSGLFSQFTCSTLPPGASCTFAHPTVALAAGGFAQVSVALTTPASIPGGTYSIQLQATDGTISPSAAFTFGIGAFSLSLNPSTVVMNGPAPSATTVTATYMGNFSQVISLSCTGLPFGTQCPGAQVLQPGSVSTSVSVYSGSPASLQAGDYPFEITGSTTGQSQSLNAVLRVTNFSATLDHTSASITVGQSSSFNVILTSLNHFTNSAISISCQTEWVTCSAGSRSLSDGSTVTVPLSVVYSPGITVSQRKRRDTELPREIYLGPWLAFSLLPWNLARQTRCKLLLALVSLIILSGLASCGGGATKNTGSTSTAGGSSGGTTTLSVPVYAQAVTADGNLQHIAGTITLTITH